MNDSSRLEAFEEMLEEIKRRYVSADEKMSALKAEGKEKTVTFRQLMTDKIMYRNMLSMYKNYGLTDDSKGCEP